MILASDAGELPASDLGDQTRDRLRRIESQARLLAQMIEDALEPDFEPDIRQLEPPGTDLDATIRAVVAPVRLTYPGDIRLLRGAQGARVAGSRMQVHRVVANVLDNAVRASGPTASCGWPRTSRATVPSSRSTTSAPAGSASRRGTGSGSRTSPR